MSHVGWRVRVRCFHHDHQTGDTWLQAYTRLRWLVRCGTCGTRFRAGRCYHHDIDGGDSWVRPRWFDFCRGRFWRCRGCGHTWWLRESRAMAL